jgi:hypothetical protein
MRRVFAEQLHRQATMAEVCLRDSDGSVDVEVAVGAA